MKGAKRIIAMVLMPEPVFAALYSVLFFGESLSAWQSLAQG